jgi:hypothetical protein
MRSEAEPGRSNARRERRRLPADAKAMAGWPAEASAKAGALFDIVNRKTMRAGRVARMEPKARSRASSDALWRNPGLAPRGTTAPHSAALHAGYGSLALAATCSGLNPSAR